MAVDSVPGTLVHQPGAARAGVMIMLIGMLMFSLNDVMGKWLVATYSVGQVVLIRSLAAALLLAPFLWLNGAQKLFASSGPAFSLPASSPRRRRSSRSISPSSTCRSRTS